MAIDAAPVLTETGGGTSMALIDGIATDSTEQLATTWCGDLMQIVDELPKDYQLINCCFAEIWDRAEYCYKTFGVSDDGYVLDNGDGKLLKVEEHVPFAGRGPTSYLKVKSVKDKKDKKNKTEFISVPISDR